MLSASRLLEELITDAHGTPLERKVQRLHDALQANTIGHVEDRFSTAMLIACVVCDCIGANLRLRQLRKKRYAKVRMARKLAMYLLATVFGESLPRIGREFGVDHTTALKARESTAFHMTQDPSFATAVERARQMCVAYLGGKDPFNANSPNGETA